MSKRYVDPKTHEGGVIKITEIVATDGLLEGHTFVGCEIQGPAVMVPLGATTMTDNDLGGPNADAILWEVPASRPVVIGAIAAIDCTFTRCKFVNVGISGVPEIIKKIRSEIH